MQKKNKNPYFYPKSAQKMAVFLEPSQKFLLKFLADEFVHEIHTDHFPVSSVGHGAMGQL